MAAAMGAELPIHEPVGNMIIDIGGGTTEVAVISLGGIVTLKAIRVGGFDIDAALQAYTRTKYSVAIGERTAEDIKLTIGSAWPVDDSLKVEVRGRDITTGLPRTLVLTSEEVREAITDPVDAIVETVVQALSECPPELSQDILLRGIFLTGGGAMLKGMDARIAEETNVPVHLTPTPLETVVRGAGKVLEDLENLKSLFM
jgi:rod shape-determining protein MreB